MARPDELIDDPQLRARGMVERHPHPTLGEAYQVDSVPNVFLIDGDGFIVDRLYNFEPPLAFAKRVKRVLKSAPKKGRAGVLELP